MRWPISSIVCRRALLATGLLAGSCLVAPMVLAATKPGIPAPAYASAPGSAPTCSMAAMVAAAKAPALRVPVPATEDRSCLISAREIGRTEDIFDLRERTAFVDFHIPGAQNATVGTLASMSRAGGKRVVVYDSGHVRSDAFLLCNRLRNAGLKQVKVIDGGIAAWAQLHAQPQALTLNRLSDADVPGALSEASGNVVVLAEAMRPALRQFGAKSSSAAGKSSRAVVLADARTPMSAIQAQLAKSRTTFYWVGAPERLQGLLGVQLAQDRKRIAGPAEPSACGAL